jgi:hypothetical protein
VSEQKALRKSEVDEVLKSFMPSAELVDKRFKKLQISPPENLCHYTTLVGLKGILDSQCLWATHSLYMNDRSETAYGYRLLAYHAKELEPTAASNLSKRFLVECQTDFLSPKVLEHPAYFTCFCTDKDMLGQWRGYSAGGGGYSLVFRIDALKRLDSSYPDTSLVKVIYSRDDQDALVTLALREMIKLLDGISGSLRARAIHAMNLVKGMLLDLLGDCFAAFKHPTFAEENEWRLVLHAPRRTYVEEGPIDRDWTPKFRAGNSLLIPYVEVPVALREQNHMYPSPVREIIVGPTVTNWLAEDSLRQMLDSLEMKKVLVKRSRIPLRSL